MVRDRVNDAKMIMSDLLNKDHTVTSELFRYLKIAFEKSNIILKNDLKELYEIYDQSTEGELTEIHGLLELIFNLHEIDKDKDEEYAVRPGEEEKIDQKVLTIWRSAISAYLGRIKELSEILRVKYEGLTKTTSVGMIDYQRVISMAEKLEDSHKKRVKCKLPIKCNNCKKRGCSSERFLREIILWVDELLKIEEAQDGVETI